MNLLSRHLKGLFDFSGRENRQPFWLWILIVYAFQMVVGIVVMIPMMSIWFANIAPLMQSDPERINAHPELVMQQMLPLMQGVMIFAAVAAVLFVVLVAAAVVRRLHDGDRSGWWASPVFALQIIGPVLYAAILPRFFAPFMTAMAASTPGTPPDLTDPRFQSVMQSMSLLTLLQMVGLLMMIVLIIFLALPGTVGPNRYGSDPLSVR